METLIHNISQVLGITVIHSLWQGLLVYLLLRILLACVPSLSSAKKHNLSLAAVVILAAWFMGTLVQEAKQIEWFARASADAALPLNYIPHFVATGDIAPQDSYFYIIKGYLPYITVVYLIGLLLNILKLCFAWRNINLVRASASPVEMLEGAVAKFCMQLNIKRKVLVSYSNMIDVPGVIGFFKPMLLLPFSITSQLSAAEVEAILLHELSHIRRNDYLLNVLQHIISVLLFFNPFALLINRIINNERENCCDDMVVNITGEPLTYARALLKLEENKQNTLQLALAATGKKHFLLNRIERIMTTKKLTVNVRHLLAAVLLFTFSVGSIAWLNPEIKNDRIVLNVKNPIRINLFTDTVPAKKVKPKTAAAKKSTLIVKQKAKQAFNQQNVYYYNDDPELERLTKEMEKHSKAIDRYFNSNEFKKLNEDMELAGKEMEAYYNSPDMKRIQDAMDRASKDFSEKWANNPEMEKLTKEMEEASKTIDKYYNSTEFKKLESGLNKESKLLNGTTFGTAAYNTRVKKIQELSDSMHKYTNNELIKSQTDKMRALSEKMHSFYGSEGYKKQQDELRMLGDSLRNKFQNGAVKKQQEYMREYGKKMRAYQNNPEIVKQKKLLEETSAKMRAYMNSPAFKKKMQQLRSEANADMKNKRVGIWTDYPEKGDSIEKPERPEKPEQIERPEQPENTDQPEQPEKVEQPENPNN